MKDSKRSTNTITPGPKVSVVMSVFNGEETLEEAIQSIQDQTYKNWNFIIINDASIDSSGEILERICDERIVVISNSTNLGLAASLNKGIDSSNAEYIARMDSDDFSLPERLRSQVEYLEANQEIDVLGGNAELMNAAGEIVGLSDMPSTTTDIESAITKLCPLIHPAVMYRKSFIEKMGGYNEKLRRKQDYDLWLRSIDEHMFENLKQPLIRYRVAKAEPFVSALRGFQLRIIHSQRRGVLVTGTYWAVVTLLVSVLRIAGYTQRSHRQRLGN